ncbi:MAG: hypothetical protein ACR2M6_02450 [Vampirovibrionia bacterium]
MEKNKIDSLIQNWIEFSNKKIKTTKRREDLIEKVLQNISQEDARLILSYIFTSDDGYACYMRENNYTSIESIFRLTKLEDKLLKATAWNRANELPDDDFGWDIK